LTRETTKLWFLTVPMIAFKYLMRRVALFVPLDHQEMVTVNLVILSKSWLIHKGITLLLRLTMVEFLSSTRMANS